MCKYFSAPLLAAFILLNVCYAQETGRKSVSVTVYNTNLGVVKDLRTFDIKQGTSKIALTEVAQLIDPTSVHIKFNGQVLEQNYQYDLVSLDKILQKYIDKDVQLLSEKDDLIEGKLLSSSGNQAVLQKKDGGLLMIPSVSKYRFNVTSLPEGLITRPTLIWQVNSPESGSQDVEVSYQTGGMNWHAEYVAVLNKDDKQMDLNSWVSIENNSGATYKDAKLKVVAGDVNVVSRAPAGYVANDGLRLQKTAEAASSFEEKSFFEYHIYDLQHPTTIAQNESKQISLFEASNIKVEKKYLYKAGNYYGEGPKKVGVIVEFENKEANNLGMPMPKGKVRLYKSDGQAIEFIGEDMIDHTPKNEKVKLKIGDAFDVLAEETQTDNKQITSKVFEQSYKITLKNRKDENITVDVERNLGANWELTSSSHEYDKKDAQTIIYKIPVKKDSESVVTFTVRYTYQ
jgi:hypothetical protein